METTAEKLLCDSTICLQQIAAATQKLYWILLCLVLIEFALEKLFFKKKKKKFQIHKYSYFSIKGKISWQHILRAGVCFWAFWGWKTLSNLSHGVFLNAATKKHPKAEYSPHLSLNKGVFFEQRNSRKLAACPTFQTCEELSLSAKNGSKRESRMCCSPVFCGLHVQKAITLWTLASKVSEGK